MAHPHHPVGSSISLYPIRRDIILVLDARLVFSNMASARAGSKSLDGIASDVCFDRARKDTCGQVLSLL